MDIIGTFEAAFCRAKNQNWDYIVVLVDIHDTIFKASWEGPENYEYLGKAKETLQLMTKMQNIRLILWSSSYEDKLLEYQHYMAQDNIFWDAVNKNIDEIKNTSLACFDNKLYFNVGIDNAFGFEPERDWIKIFNYLNNYNK